jgi:hypothetical protein
MTDIDRSRTSPWRFKFQPVAWLTVVGVVGGALLEADRQEHILPAGAGHWVAFAVVAATFIVTALKARGAATPVADPRTESGVPLVPVTAAPHLRPSPGAGEPGR